MPDTLAWNGLALDSSDGGGPNIYVCGARAGTERDSGVSEREWEKEHMHCGKIIPGVRLGQARRRPEEIEQNTERR